MRGWLAGVRTDRRPEKGLSGDAVIVGRRLLLVDLLKPLCLHDEVSRMLGIVAVEAANLVCL